MFFSLSCANIILSVISFISLFHFSFPFSTFRSLFLLHNYTVYCIIPSCNSFFFLISKYHCPEQKFFPPSFFSSNVISSIVTISTSLQVSFSSSLEISAITHLKFLASYCNHISYSWLYIANIVKTTILTLFS